MRLVNTSSGATGTRYEFSWSYRKLNSEKELKNVLIGKGPSDIYDIQQFVDPEMIPSVAFQVGGEGLFQDFKESFRYTCELELFKNNFPSEPGTASAEPWYKKIGKMLKSLYPH